MGNPKLAALAADGASRLRDVARDAIEEYRADQPEREREQKAALIAKQLQEKAALIKSNLRPPDSIPITQRQINAMPDGPPQSRFARHAYLTVHSDDVRVSWSMRIGARLRAFARKWRRATVENPAE